MEATFSGLSLMFAASILMAVVVGTILCIFPRHVKSPNPWLGVGMFSLAWGMFVAFALESKLIYAIPHIYRTGHPIGILFFPASYLYVRNVIYPGPLSRWDLLHLLPPLVYVVDYTPFFILPADEKMNAVAAAVNDLRVVNEYSDGWIFPAHFHLLFRYCVLALYWVLEIAMIVKLKDAFFRVQVRYAKVWRNWMVTFLMVQFLIFFPYFVGWLLRADDLMFSIISFSIMGSVAVAAIGLLFRPEILYGLRGQNGSKSGLDAESKLIFRLNHDIASRHSSNGHSGHEIEKNIDDMMSREKPFLKHKYSLQDMSVDLKVPAYQLSQYLNKNLNLSFSDCLNRYRIEHCLERIKSEDVSHLTLEAIAFECGFSNRNSFTTAFKKWTGRTPSDVLGRKRTTS